MLSTTGGKTSRESLQNTRRGIAEPAKPGFVGNDKLLLGIVLSVVTYWLFCRYARKLGHRRRRLNWDAAHHGIRGISRSATGWPIFWLVHRGRWWAGGPDWSR